MTAYVGVGSLLIESRTEQQRWWRTEPRLIAWPCAAERRGEERAHDRERERA